MMKKRAMRILEIAAVTVGAFSLTRLALRKMAQYDFVDKVVLITGGFRGLGLVLAREFARQGARVVICARDEEKIERARIDLQRLGAQVLALKCDVTIRSEVAEMISVIHDHYGKIDVLVNNAGVIQVGPLEVMTQEDFAQAINTHFWAPLHCILAVLPEMRKRKEGRIVNISSIGGKIGVPHLVPYSASKFALVGLSEGLGAELRKDGVRITTVCPGLMRTGSPRNADFKGRHRAEYAWFSISDALPLASISAKRAARQITLACKRGQASLVISFPAKVAVFFNGAFPELTADLLAQVNKFLPEPGGIGTRRAKGKDSASQLSPSWITSLNERAAAMNNEI